MSVFSQISISGIDFTGKSTLAGKLADALNAQLFIFPSKNTKAGIEARESLLNNSITFEKREMLFLKDAYVNGRLIGYSEMDVVTDRSPLCQMAYRFALDKDYKPYMDKILRVRGFLPNLVILLTITENTLKDRMKSRGTDLDVLEDVDISIMLKRQEGYKAVLNYYVIPYIIIDTDNKTPEEVLAETIDSIQQKRKHVPE